MIVSFEFSTPQEAHKKLAIVAETFGYSLTSKKGEVDPAQLSFPIDEEVTTKPKPSRKVKPKLEVPQTIEVVRPPEVVIPIEVVVPTPIEVTPPTKEEATKALGLVNSTKGLAAAREVLLKFGGQRISEIKPEDYAALIEACQALV